MQINSENDADIPKKASKSSTNDFGDRFLAFAFAAADLLIEADERGRVVFAVGASNRLLGKAIEEVIDSHLTDLVDRSDKSLMRALIRNHQTRIRVGPLSFTSTNQSDTLSISAIRSGKYDHLYLTISCGANAPKIASKTSLGPETLTSGGGQSLEALFEEFVSRKDIGELELSLVRVIGLTKLSSTQYRRVKGVVDELMGVLRCLSLDGQAVTQLGAGQFATLGVAGRRGDLSEQLSTTVEECGLPISSNVDVRTIALGDMPLAGDELMAALSQLAREFAGSPERIPETGLTDALYAKLEETRDRISKSRHLIQRRDFTMVFQPIVDVKSKEIHHFEALARISPGASPAEFVAFAENAGLIADFDLAVVETVLHRMGKLNRQCTNPKIAVNVSARSLSSDLFVERIKRLFSCHYEIAKQLLFEITETSQIVDLERANTIIQDWRSSGNEVCLDDFGAGAAAFHYVRSLTVDYIKLDGGYVGRHLFSPRDASILQAMVTLSRNLKVATVAEMVEDDAQLESLRTLGVDLAQGYLFGKPSTDAVRPNWQRRAQPNDSTPMLRPSSALDLSGSA